MQRIRGLIIGIGVSIVGAALAASDNGAVWVNVKDAKGAAITHAKCWTVHTGDEQTTLGSLYIGGLPLGRTLVTCRATGYDPGSKKVTVKADQVTKLTLRLKANGQAIPTPVAQQTVKKKVSTRKGAVRLSERSLKAGATSGQLHAVLGDASGTAKGFGGLGVRGSGRGGGGYGKGSIGLSTIGSGGGHLRSGYGRAAGPGHRVEVRYPTNFMPSADRENYEALKENPYKPAKESPLSTLSIDVDTAAYSNARRFLNQGRMPPKDAARIEDFVNYFDYDYPAPDGEHPFSITTEVSTAPWNPEHRLVHLGLQATKIERDNLPRSNLVFLLDVSGSMNRHDKLPLLKQAFNLLVRNLDPRDRVAVVVYAGAAGLVLPSTPAKDREKILGALNNLRAGGSTAGGAGIELAYKIAQQNFIEDGNNRVILATDGDFNVGVSSDGGLVRMVKKKRKSGVFLTVLGFGQGNYQASKMEKLANKGNGNFAYIDSILEAQKVLVSEMGGTLVTVAQDVKFQVEFNPTKVKAWRLLGYENRVLAARDFNDDKKDAGELGAGHTVTVLYELIPADSAENVASVDPLKYQQRTVEPSNELMTVKLRYKQPKGKKSTLITQPLVDQHSDLAATSNAFRFSSAAAEFAMLLRDDKHKGQASYEAAAARAREAIGKDPHGHRLEMVQLIKKAGLMKQAHASR